MVEVAPRGDGRRFHGGASSRVRQGVASQIVSNEPRAAKREVRLVPEVPAPGEDHGCTRRLYGRDYLVVTARPARLHDHVDAGCEGELWAVGEREERVARENRSRQVVPVLPRL